MAVLLKCEVKLIIFAPHIYPSYVPLQLIPDITLPGLFAAAVPAQQFHHVHVAVTRRIIQWRFIKVVGGI